MNAVETSSLRFTAIFLAGASSWHRTNGEPDARNICIDDGRLQQYPARLPARLENNTPDLLKEHGRSYRRISSQKVMRNVVGIRASDGGSE